jgi:hypothetical protein
MKFSEISFEKKLKINFKPSAPFQGPNDHITREKEEVTKKRGRRPGIFVGPVS